jgi:hypothetical protein
VGARAPTYAEVNFDGVGIRVESGGTVYAGLAKGDPAEQHMCAAPEQTEELFRPSSAAPTGTSEHVC